LPEVLDSVAQMVSDTLGFETVVINLYREAGDEYEVTTVHGNERARDTLLGDVSSASSWATLLDASFLRRGVFFVPAGALDWSEELHFYTPELPAAPADATRAWQADDALFAPLEGAGGRHYGIISVDEPASGLRPDDQQLDVLAAIAALAAQTIENADRFSQLQSALIRHRTILGSSLDGVIAIDAQGRILEFNPAAERIFGYRAQDALGLELASLIVAPEEGDAHWHGLARAIEDGDWQLLRRRLEVTGIRADGRHLPVELSLTLVRESPDTGPVLYGFVRDISERRRGEEQLAFLAYHDSLTGLPNRALVEQQLDLALARARRGESAVALMFVDLDDFKEVNDRLGHAAGDELLTGVAARLRGVLRDTDVLARQGGTNSWSCCLTSTSHPHPLPSWWGPSCSGPCANRSWSAPRSCVPVPASESACSPTMPLTPRPCCPTPMPRCTAPKGRAEAGWPSISPLRRSSRGASASRPSCAGRCRIPSSSFTISPSGVSVPSAGLTG
jgi:PAS domain S-box-containing protein